MAKATVAEIRAAILKEIPKDGASVGNASLRERVAARLGAKVREDDYFEARDALVAKGKLAVGRGRGGSVRLVRATSVKPAKAAELVAKAAANARPPKSVAKTAA